MGLWEGEAGLLVGPHKMSSGNPLGLEEVDPAGGSGVGGREPRGSGYKDPSSKKELI